ncbi:ring-opening amidohydrolase [Limnohabitans sp. JirII-31]|uniref:cyanuric acid amidohydrolase n=1 Tax=Limnohabitans sp. JirII-31 TaxID=1977908 RepID=UPI000C1F409B|nr:ring-opening amidohydrolase [Limnohabitans sp. JirII-31]PIT80754.1 cyanuric acid amidohydrolase [Limnohabitans sp. JirII-31]
MPQQIVTVQRVLCQGPSDLSGVQQLVDQGLLDPRHIVAVMGKTEGNGCVNDHTRDFASMAWCHWLAPHLGCSPEEAHQRVALVMSGGTEGVLSPHFTVFSRQWVGAQAPSPTPRLVVGVAQTRDFAPWEMGRMAQIQATAQAVKAAMQEAQIEQAADVHFVQIKCPLLTMDKIRAAQQQGHDTVTHDTYESMGYSRAASALGVALALGEITPTQLSDEAVMRDMSLYSSTASASSGIELENNVVVVLGMSRAGQSNLAIAHTVMQDAIDARSVTQMLHACGLLNTSDTTGAEPTQLVNLLAKAEAAPSGKIRGTRHTMLDDSDINATRHARAAVGGVLASLTGQTALYVSGGAEHQGPAGGGPVCVIYQPGELCG